MRTLRATSGASLGTTSKSRLRRAIRFRTSPTGGEPSSTTAMSAAAGSADSGTDDRNASIRPKASRSAGSIASTTSAPYANASAAASAALPAGTSPQYRPSGFRRKRQPFAKTQGRTEAEATSARERRPGACSFVALRAVLLRERDDREAGGAPGRGRLRGDAQPLDAGLPHRGRRLDRLGPVERGQAWRGGRGGSHLDLLHADLREVGDPEAEPRGVLHVARLADQDVDVRVRRPATPASLNFRYFGERSQIEMAPSAFRLSSMTSSSSRSMATGSVPKRIRRGWNT